MMSTIDEPEWILAKRESDRRFRNVVLSVWLACIPIALVMMIASQFDYEAAVEVAAGLMLLISIACLFARRQAEKGSLTRAFGTTLAVFSLIGAVFLAPTVVTHWG